MPLANLIYHFLKRLFISSFFVWGIGYLSFLVSREFSIQFWLITLIISISLLIAKRFIIKPECITVLIIVISLTSYNMTIAFFQSCDPAFHEDVKSQILNFFLNSFVLIFSFISILKNKNSFELFFIIITILLICLNMWYADKGLFYIFYRIPDKILFSK